MIIKDLLGQCPVDEIVSEIMCIGGIGEEQRERVYALHEGLADRLQGIEPAETGHVILAATRMEDGSRFDDIYLFSISEIREQFRSSKVLPESYCFVYSPWAEVLGYQVDEKNLIRFGKSRVLARVIYEMTFFGFTEEQVSEERKKLDEAIAESEKIRSLPPEEREKYYVSAEKLFEEAGYEDHRTPEEKEAERQMVRRENRFNRLQKYRVLKAYTGIEE